MEEMAQDLSGRQNQINSDIFSSKKKATHFYIPKAGQLQGKGQHHSQVADAPLLILCKRNSGGAYRVWSKENCDVGMYFTCCPTKLRNSTIFRPPPNLQAACFLPFRGNQYRRIYYLTMILIISSKLACVGYIEIYCFQKTATYFYCASPTGPETFTSLSPPRFPSQSTSI